VAESRRTAARAEEVAEVATPKSRAGIRERVLSYFQKNSQAMDSV
jgi:hypothetical protein